MKRKGLIVAAAILAFVLIVALAVPFFVNPEQFRPKIEAMLSESLARPVKIGALHLSIFAGGISADDVSVAEDKAFGNAPFITAKQVKIGVEMMPLITSRTLHVRSFTIDSPDIRLVRADNGRWNFSSLGAAGGAKQKPETTGSQSNLSVDKVKISNGRITIARAGGNQANEKPTVYDHVSLEATKVSMVSSFPFHLALQTPGNGQLKADGTAGPVSQKDVSETPLDAKISVDHVDLAKSGVLDPSSGIGGVLSYAGTVKSTGRQISSAGSGKVENIKLVAAGTPAKIPVGFDYATVYDTAQQRGTVSKGLMRLGSSQARVSGTYETAGKVPAVDLKLTAQNIPIQDLQALLPAVGVVLPAGANLQGGTASADLSISGRVDKLVTTGPVSIAQTKLAGFDLGSKLKTLGALAGVPAGSETTIQSLDMQIRVAPEGIRAENLKMVAPALGTLTGNGTVGANNALNFKMLAQVDTSKSVLGAISTVAGIGRGGTARIPFTIQGTTSNPVFVPDVGGVLGNANSANPTSNPTKSVGDVLQGLFGKKK